MKLYICGNGFDLYHGFKTGYYDYKEYLSKNYPVSVKRFESFKYLNTCKLDKWSDLESSLSINYLDCIKDALVNYHPAYKDNSDSRWHNIEIDLDEETKFANNFTGKYFIEWLLNVDLSVSNKALPLDKESFFINFNYTNTLENLYNIPSDRVYHIHGYLDSIREINTTDDKHYNQFVRKNIQFGSIYNEYFKIEEELDETYQDDEYFELAIKPGILHIAEFCRVTYKDLAGNYSSLKNILNTYSFEEVIIMGHSIVGIDTEYYDELLVPYLNKCKWTFYIHNKEDEQNVNKFKKNRSLKESCLEKW